jgi:hypothetical protein
MVNGNWTTISGNASDIAVYDEHHVFCVNSSGSIYQYIDGSWKTLSGEGHSISVGRDGLCVANHSSAQMYFTSL